MNHNRKRREAEARERRRREALLTNSAPVDHTALDPDNYGFLLHGFLSFIERGYYLDVPFTCASCGSEEVWTAPQQKWWYEVAKGSPHSGAKLCRSCRQDARRHKGKAHPLQNTRRWCGLIRDDLEPALLAAGWHPVIGVGEPRPALLSYTQGDVLVRLRWDDSSFGSTLILERRDALDSVFRTLVKVKGNIYDMTHGTLQRRFDDFLTAARHTLGLAAKP
ncbi:zinc-ribbon domain-containing protein [Singulisphaera acidiphila]|uniref:Probable zinc-binding domain-containing protein n=1 Tax=Singulisphaera acidiphila (strain ATCC BAA-1392 / DSM 18658 / VKM B-2454 / MOB10) TaxID=886293 RepID=L0DI35_SINAD|nr:zinc-ribbon domain-containing protein [Singulisphaera acidiphila]AGA28515.1 hypothetical protein Sinac_4317 [Singulisphaera acidiphila DSM 18658]